MCISLTVHRLAISSQPRLPAIPVSFSLHPEAGTPRTRAQLRKLRRWSTLSNVCGFLKSVSLVSYITQSSFKSHSKNSDSMEKNFLQLKWPEVLTASHFLKSTCIKLTSLMLAKPPLVTAVVCRIRDGSTPGRS